MKEQGQMLEGLQASPRWEHSPSVAQICILRGKWDSQLNEVFEGGCKIIVMHIKQHKKLTLLKNHQY